MKYSGLPVYRAPSIYVLQQIPPDSIPGASEPAQDTITGPPESTRDTAPGQPDTLVVIPADTLSRVPLQESPAPGIKPESPPADEQKEIPAPYYLKTDERPDTGTWLQSLDEVPYSFRKQELWTGTGTPAPGPSNEGLSAKHKARPMKSDWILGIVIISLIFLIWVRIFFNKYFALILVSLFNYQRAFKVFRDQNQLTRGVNIALNLNFLLIGGVFTYQVMGHFELKGFQYGPGMNYLLYIAVIAGLLIARYITSHITAFLFRKRSLFREYLFNIYLIYKSLGIFLIPVVLMVNYIQEALQVYLIYAGIAMAGAGLMLRIIRGIQITLKKDILMFYLILYLCTLEILPVLCAIQVLCDFDPLRLFHL